MKKTYKDIPKELRKHYMSSVVKQVWQAVKAAVIFPKLYSKRVELFNLGLVKDNLDLPDNHLYWYVDNSEHIDGDGRKPLDFVSCWWGDAPFRERIGYNHESASKLKKFIYAFKWTVLRNSVWNYKTRVGLKFKAGFTVHERLLNTGGAGITTWRNLTIHGEQSVILKLKGTDELYYRYSYTVPLNKFSVWRLFGFKYTNRMRGVENRYLYKNRLSK